MGTSSWLQQSGVVTVVVVRPVCVAEKVKCESTDLARPRGTFQRQDPETVAPHGSSVHVGHVLSLVDYSLGRGNLISNPLRS